MGDLDGVYIPTWMCYPQCNCRYKCGSCETVYLEQEAVLRCLVSHVPPEVHPVATNQGVYFYFFSPFFPFLLHSNASMYFQLMNGYNTICYNSVHEVML